MGPAQGSQKREFYK
jgi:RNA polymerase II subunit A small phosphatase-like protein